MWQEGSGWPLTLADLAPYYQRVRATWIGHRNGTEERLGSVHPQLEFRENRLTTRMAEYGAADVFSLRFRDELRAAPNVDVRVGANVVELRSDCTGAEVREAVAVCSDGSHLRVRASTFILACGGVENVQTLLSSEATHPGAVGNRYDNVGRYVTDHPEFRMGRIIPADRSLIDAVGLYDMHWVGTDMVSGLLTLSEATKRAESLLNVGAVLVPQPAAFGSDGERALRSLHALGKGRARRVDPSHLRTLLTAPDQVADVLRMRRRKRRGDFDYPDGFVWHRGGWSRPGFDRAGFDVLEVHAATEQSPHRENRIGLSPRHDRLGRRSVDVRMHWSETDHANLVRTMRIFAAEVQAAGIGRFEPWVDFTGPQRPVNDGFHHPMGGTRMHHDPRVSVVDADCRVHGMENLYVAGSSVFTTGLGYSNPTLTLLALSTRLADHVRARHGDTVDREPVTAGLSGSIKVAI